MTKTSTALQGGYTNQAFGDAIGCSHSMASRIVTGKRMPSIDLIERISETFGIPLKTLLSARHKGVEEFGRVMQRQVVAPANRNRAKASR